MKQQLEPLLDAFAGDAPSGVSNDFMEGVWERVGHISARRERTMRSALFAGLLAVGLGAGVATVQTPAYALDRNYPLLNESRLSPSALLHVSP